MSATRTWSLLAAFVLAAPLHGFAQEAPPGKPALPACEARLTMWPLLRRFMPGRTIFIP